MHLPVFLYGLYTCMTDDALIYCAVAVWSLLLRRSTSY